MSDNVIIRGEVWGPPDQPKVNRFWSATDKTRADWETPEAFFRWRDRIHHFDVDAAANADNAKLPHWFGPGSQMWHPLSAAENGKLLRIEDALDPAVQWWREADRFWCNPPYGRLLIHWIRCFARQAEAGAFIETVLPVATSTDWYRLAFETAEAIEFLEDRLAFELDGVPADNSNINSMLVRWQPHGTQGSASTRLIQWKPFMLVVP